MKKSMFPIILVLSLAIGGYFLLFHKGSDSPKEPAPETVEATGKEVEKEKTRDEIEAEIRRKEAAAPAKFIKLDYSFKKKLLGGYEATGSVFNNATETYYKDTEVRMYFLDAAGDKLDSVSTIIFKEFGPGDRVPFEVQHDSPKGTQMVTLAVINAKVSG